MSDNINILIADGMPQARAALKDMLSSEKRFNVMGECSDGEATVKTVLDTDTDVVIMDINMPLLDGISAAEILSSAKPNIIIIVTMAEEGEEAIKRAMQSGARYFFRKPFSELDISHIIIDLYDKQQMSSRVYGSRDFFSSNKKSQIISVFSTKGGVGKTTVAANLAVALSERSNGKVALLDLDLQFGDIPIMFNIYPNKTIADLAGEVNNMGSDVIEEFMIEHESGVRVLSAPLTPEYAEYINGHTVENILRILIESYKYIIIDTAPSFNDVNLTVMDMSDQIFFITTLDLSTIKNVKAGLQIMNSLKYSDRKVTLVLNRYHRHFGISNNELEKIFDKKVEHIIPEDNINVIQAMNEGTPLVISKNRSRSAKSIIEMAEKLCDESKAESKKIFSRAFER